MVLDPRNEPQYLNSYFYFCEIKLCSLLTQSALLTWDRSTCRGWPGIRWRRRTGSWRWCTKRRVQTAQGGSGAVGRYTAWRAGKRWSVDPPGQEATCCLCPAGCVWLTWKETQNSSLLPIILKMGLGTAHALQGVRRLFDAPHRIWSLPFKHAKDVHMLLQQLTAVMCGSCIPLKVRLYQPTVLSLDYIRWCAVNPRKLNFKKKKKLFFSGRSF